MLKRRIILSEITECLRKSPLRVTRKREQILGAMLTLDRPASAAEIRTQANLPESDLVTVYRTLEAFSEIGITQSIPLENGTNLYELTAPGDHHHHFICRNCHRTERIDLCLAHELEERANSLGYTQITHILEVYGFCPECSENQKEQP